MFTKHFLDTDYDVKEQYVYTEDALIEWLNILYSYDYNVAFYKRKVVMLRHRTDYEDVFIIHSKWDVTKELLHKIFFFDDGIVSIRSARELFGLIST